MVTNICVFVLKKNITVERTEICFCILCSSHSLLAVWSKNLPVMQVDRFYPGCGVTVPSVWPEGSSGKAGGSHY